MGEPCQNCGKRPGIPLDTIELTIDVRQVLGEWQWRLMWPLAELDAFGGYWVASGKARSRRRAVAAAEEQRRVWYEKRKPWEAVDA